MSLKELHKGNEDERRKRIIDASIKEDTRYLPQLLALLNSGETYDNKRHIIRALGNIGGPEAEKTLVEWLTNSSGLILGEVCRSLGKLNMSESCGEIMKLREHKESWVRQEAISALKKLNCL